MYVDTYWLQYPVGQGYQILKTKGMVLTYQISLFEFQILTFHVFTCILHHTLYSSLVFFFFLTQYKVSPLSAH